MTGAHGPIQVRSKLNSHFARSGDWAEIYPGISTGAVSVELQHKVLAQNEIIDLQRSRFFSAC